MKVTIKRGVKSFHLESGEEKYKFFRKIEVEFSDEERVLIDQLGLRKYKVLDMPYDGEGQKMWSMTDSEIDVKELLRRRYSPLGIYIERYSVTLMDEVDEDLKERLTKLAQILEAHREMNGSSTYESTIEGLRPIGKQPAAAGAVKERRFKLFARK